MAYFLFPGKYLQYPDNTTSTNGNRFSSSSSSPKDLVAGVRYSNTGSGNVTNKHYNSGSFNDTDKIIVTSVIAYTSNPSYVYVVDASGNSSDYASSYTPYYLENQSTFNLDLYPMILMSYPSAINVQGNRYYSDSFGTMFEYWRSQIIVHPIEHNETVRVSFYTNIIDLSSPTLRNNIRNGNNNISSNITGSYVTINSSTSVIGVDGYGSGNGVDSSSFTKNSYDICAYNVFNPATEGRAWISESGDEAGYIYNQTTSMWFYEHNDLHILGVPQDTTNLNSVFTIGSSHVEIDDIKISSPTNTTASIYICVYTCIEYDRVSGILSRIPDTAESYELWGPIIRVIIPSSVSLTTNSGWNMLVNDSGAFKLGSAANYTGFKYGDGNIDNKYPVHAEYVLPSSLYTFPVVVNRLLTHTGEISLNERNFKRNNSTGVVSENITITTTSTLTTINDASVYLPSPFNVNTPSKLFNICNEYRVYVYPESAVNISYGVASFTGQYDNYSYTIDSSGNITVNISCLPGETVKLYLRDVLEETYYDSTGDMFVHKYTDYNPTYDVTAGTYDFTHQTISTNNISNYIYEPASNKYLIGADYIHHPQSDSPYISGLSDLIGTVYQSESTHGALSVRELTFTAPNNTSSSSIVLKDFAESEINNITINIEHSAVYVKTIDASILKGEDQNDPIVEIPLHKSSSLTNYTYIPWEPSETGYNNEHTTTPILLWLQTGYTTDGGTPTNIGYTATIDSSSSIEFGPNTSGSQWNQRDGSLGDMSNNMISFKVKSPGVTTLTLTSKDGGTPVATSTYVIAVYTPVASIRFTGGKASDPSSSDIQIGTAAYVNLWSVPDEYHINDNTYPSVQSIWNDSAYRVNILFNDCSGNIITDGQSINGALSPIYSREGFGTATQISIAPGLYFGASDYSNVTYQQVVTNTDNRLFNTGPLSAGAGQATMYLFPGDASNNSYPYPSSGLAYVTINNIKKTSSDPHSISEQFGVKINKTTDTITNVIPDPSNHMIEGSYVAGEPIKYTVSVNGDEPMNTWNLSATEEDELGITYSYDNNGHITVTFPVSMASPWTGDIIITMINHYGQPVLYTVENVSVIPSVSSLSISYNGNIIATESSTGYIANRDDPFYWYTLNTSTERETFNLVGTVATGNINWTVSPANEELSPIPASSSSTSGQPLEFYFNTRRNNNNYNYTITAESSAVSSIHAIAYIVPMRITTLTYIERTGSGALNPGDSTTISIYTNGNEDVVLADALSYVVVLDSNGTVVSNPQITFSNPTLITEPVSGYNGVQYTVTVDNGIASNKTLYLHARFTNKDGSVIDSSTSCEEYVELNINKSEATSITLKKASDDSTIDGSLGNYWFAPGDTFGFYGTVAGSTLTTALKHIKYTILQGDRFAIFNKTATDIPSGKSSGTVSLVFADVKNINSRNAVCEVKGESKQTSSVYKTFNIVPLRITDSLTGSLSSTSVSAGNTTKLTLTINGDETLSRTGTVYLPTLQYSTSASSGYSSTLPSDLSSVVCSSVSSDGRTAEFTITVSSSASTTRNIYIKPAFSNHNSASIALSGTNPYVTLQVKPAGGAYDITATSNKSVVYGTEPATITIQHGYGVESYAISVEGAGASYTEFLVDGETSWRSSGASGFSSNAILVRRKSGSSTATVTIKVTAEQKDTAASSYSSSSVNIILGTITYSMSPSNGYVYQGDSIVLTATFNPTLETYLSAQCWNCPVSSSLSDNNTVLTVTPGTTALGNKSIVFTYDNTNTYDTHTFSINVLNPAEDKFYLDPSTQTLLWLTGDVTAEYNVIKGQNILSIDTVSLDRAPVHLTNPILNTSVNPNKVTISSNGDPGLGSTAEIRTFILTATKINGDTSTNNNAGEVTLRNGNSGHTFYSDPTSQTVDGNTGLSATYTITCNHKANGNTVDDRDTVTASTTATWCSVSYNNGTLTVTTTSKCYKQDRTAQITLSSSVDGHSPITVSFTQEYLRITPIFEIANTAIFDSVSSSEADLVFKTAPATSEKTKQFQMNCGYIEKTKDGTEVSTVMGSDYSISSTSLGSWGNATTTTSGTKTVNVSVTGTNTNTAANSGYFVLQTSYPTNITDTNASYRINVSQPGTVYNTFILTANGNSSDYTMTASSNNQSLTVPVVCEYNYVQDGITHTAENVSWNLNSSSLSWFTATKNGTNITIAVELNNGESGRSASMTVSSTFDGRSTEKSITITFTQNAAKIEFEPASLNQFLPNRSEIQYNELKISTHNSDADWYIIPPASESFVTNVYSGPTNPTSVVGASNARKNDSSIRVTFNGDNMAAGNDYVRYRSTTTDRSTSLTVRPVETENISSTINISQAGYSWEKVYVPSETALAFAANEVEKTFTVKTNYDVDFTLNTSIDVPANALTVEEYSLTGNKFTDNENNTIEKTFNCTLKLYCNPEITEKNGKIIISQKKHGTEDNIESKEITFRQTAPGNLRSLDLKNLSPEPGYTYQDGDTIEVTSLRSTLRCEVLAILSGWTLSTDVSWIHFSVESHDYSKTNMNSQDNTLVDIDIDSYPDVTNERYGRITLTSKEDSNVTKSYTIKQRKADMYFKVLAEDPENPYVNNVPRLKEAFANMENASSTWSIDLGNDLDCGEHKYTYYLEYYKGSADPGINFQASEGGYIYVDNSTIPELDASPQNNPEKYIYVLNFTISRNDSINKRLNMWLTIRSTSNANVYVTFNASQQANSYEAEGNITFSSSSYIGQEINGNYIIPVYGGTYNLTLINHLENDSIIIDHANFISNLPSNVDTDVEGNWGSIRYEGNNIIAAGKTKILTVTINEYTINESNEKPISESVRPEHINTKYYAVEVVCYASSSPTQKKYSLILNIPYTNDMLIAEQSSIDLNKTEPWKLLSPESNNGEPQRVYAPNDFSGVSNDRLYSKDTGYTVKYHGDISTSGEIGTMRNIVDTGAIALDERFGVR